MISILKKRVQKVLIPLLLVAMAFTHFFMNTQTISASPATTTITNMVTSNHATISKGWNTIWVGYGYLTDNQGNYLWCLQPYRVHHNVTHTGSEWNGAIAGGIGDLDGFTGTVEAIQLSASQVRHLEKAAMFAQMNGSQAYLKFMGLYTWEVIGWEVESIDNGEWDAYQSFKADINAKIEALNHGVSFDDTSYTLKVGESITLTDTNNNLQHLDIPSELNGYLLSVNGNQLTITATNNSIDGSLRFGPNNSFITYQGTSFLYRSPSNSQELTSLKVKDPIILNINLNTIKNDVVHVLKTNENGSAEAGVVYGLYSDSGATQLVKQATTDGNGLADFGEVELALGKVYVKEISAPAHLVLSNEIKEVDLVGGQTHSVSFKNDFVREEIQVLKTNENGKPEANVVYGLYSDPQATNKLQEVTTNGQGQATFSNVSVGLDTVYVKEISAPAHLVLSDEIKAVKLIPGKEHSVSFTNTFVRVDIDVMKLNDEGQAEANVVIGLYSDPQATNKLQEVTTNAQGQAKFTQLSVDLKKVYVKELSVPPHLVLNKDIKTIELVPNETHTVTFVNEQVRGRIQIVKVDANNEEMPIENAIFGVYRAGTMELIEKIKTDRDGFAYSSDLKYGDYDILELEAPVEYYLNPNRYPVSIREHGKTVVKYIANDQVLVKLQVIKSDQETAERLAGVVFEVRNKATGEVVEFEYLNDQYVLVKQTQLVTNEQGEAFTRGFLKYGEYQLVEVKAKDGYLTIEPLDFVINRDTETVDLNVIGTTKVQPITNTKTTTEISKQDVYGQGLSGATLKLVEKETGKEIAQWVSSDEAMVIRGLAFDKTYTLIEVKAPDGYFVAEPIDFVINADGTTTKVVMHDEKIPTIHTLAQVNDEKVVEAVGTLTLTDKVFYQDLIVGKEYEAKLVWMDQATGQPFLVNGQPLTVTKHFIPTETSGEVVLSVEVEAKHFVKTVSLVAFEDLFKEGKHLVAHANIHDVDQTVKILKPTIQSKAMVLSFDPSNLNVVTVKESINFGELRAGLTYTNKAYVVDKATGMALLNAEGKPIVVSTLFTAESDTHDIEVLFELPIELLKKGNLVVVDDLYLNDQLVASHRELENKDQTVSFVEVKIRKVDSQDKTKVLKEAEFTVYQNGVAIKTVKTDENGLAVFVLPEGAYILKETKAPVGYKLSKDVIEVNITGQEIDHVFEVVAPNVALPKILINTGVESMDILIYVGIGLVLGGLILVIKKRKNNDE